MTNAKSGLYISKYNSSSDSGEADSYLDPDEANSFPLLFFTLLDEAGEPDFKNNKKKSGHFLSSLLTPEAIINRRGSADNKFIFSM